MQISLTIIGLVFINTVESSRAQVVHLDDGSMYDDE